MVGDPLDHSLKGKRVVLKGRALQFLHSDRIKPEDYSYAEIEWISNYYQVRGVDRFGDIVFSYPLLRDEFDVVGSKKIERKITWV